MCRLALAAVTLGAVCAGAQTISQYQRSDGPGAQIEVDATHSASYRIPRTLYGTFLEDIGHSVFGGVSSQLIDNPSLEAYDASLGTLSHRFAGPEYQQSSQIGLPLPWLPLDAHQGWRYEPRWGHAANSNRYLYVMGMPGKSVGIRQRIYVPIERERTYAGVLFVWSENGTGHLQVSFRSDAHPEQVLAQATLAVPAGHHWTRLPFRLQLPAGAVQPLQPVDFAIALQGAERMALDEIRLYPADVQDGLDPEIIAAARSLHTPILRYGGNFTSGYHWRDGVGPLDRRPTKADQSWGYPEYNEFGTGELMEFCQRIGARPQICLNLGSGTPAEARAWVEYCQGAADTPMGKLRAANGHPAPYPVAAWELGNELWGQFQIGWQTAKTYPRRYEQFYQTVRSAVAPGTMMFANGADIDFFHDWNGNLITQDGKDLHFLTSHFVVGMDEILDHHADRTTRLMDDFAVPVGVGRALVPMQQQVQADPATRDRVKLAYTEWLFAAPEHSGLPRWDNMGGALQAAAWMNMLFNHADFVRVSDMTGLLEFGGIFKRRGRVYVTPQYWAFSLYSNLAGDEPVATTTSVAEYDVHHGQRRVPEIANVPWLDVVATRNSKTGALALFVVNRDWQHDIATRIYLDHFEPKGAATVHTLDAASIADGNDEEHPHAVEPKTTTLPAGGTSFQYTLPAHSVTVFTWPQQ